MRVNAERFKLLRYDAGLSQRQLAKRAGVSHTSVWDIERGGNVRPETLKKVCDVLGVRPSELLPEDSL